MSYEMFDYNIFDNISIAMKKAKAYSRIKKELKAMDISSNEKIQLCKDRAKELIDGKKEIEQEVMRLKKIRDDAVDNWIDEYGVDGGKDDVFEAFEACEKEDKAFEAELDRLLDCEAMIKAYDKAIYVIEKEIAKNVSKSVSRR